MKVICSLWKGACDGTDMTPSCDLRFESDVILEGSQTYTTIV